MCASIQEPDKHLTFRIEAETAEALERLAKVNDRSVSAELRLAVRAYLAEQKAAA